MPSMPPDTHSIYMPATQKSVDAHMSGWSFWPKNLAQIATMMMYVVVRNPALPATATPSGYAAMPNCCKFAATNRVSPHHMPAFMVCLGNSGAFGADVSIFFAMRALACMKQNKKINAIVLLLAFSVNDPMWLAADVCATNDTPQIKAVIRRMRVPLVFSFFKMSPHFISCKIFVENRLLSRPLNSHVNSAW